MIVFTNVDFKGSGLEIKAFERRGSVRYPQGASAGGPAWHPDLGAAVAALGPVLLAFVGAPKAWADADGFKVTGMALHLDGKDHPQSVTIKAHRSPKRGQKAHDLTHTCEWEKLTDEETGVVTLVDFECAAFLDESKRSQVEMELPENTDGSD